MVITAIQAPLQVTTQNNAVSHSHESMNLDGLVNPASIHDISSFQSTVQNIIQQNASFATNTSSTFFGQSEGNIVTNLIDHAQNSRREIANLASNGDKLSSKGYIQLQEATENFTLTTQLLSKGMSLATKAIDGLVHIQ